MMHWLLNLIESYLFSTDEMTVDEFKESVNEVLNAFDDIDEQWMEQGWNV